MKWLKQNWFRLGALIFLSAIALSVFSYYLIILPYQEEQKFELEKQAQEYKQQKEQRDKIEQEV